MTGPASTTATRTAPGLDDWLTPARIALLLALLVFIAFPQVLLGWETFVIRDFGNFAYPCAFFQRQCFWRGELPLWNPYNSCGTPFLAQWNTMCLYPPALIYLLLPLPWSLNFFCLLHLWFGGFGMYLLARRWTQNSLGASVAGIVFAFNGLSQNFLMWPSHNATFGWMPWVILAAESGWALGGRKLIVAALAGSLQFLAGGPETILLTWLLAFALCLTSSTPNWRLTRRQLAAFLPLFRLAWIVFLVGAICAAQLLPFLHLAAHSQRHTGFADTRWSLPLRGWANFLVPLAFGSTWNQDVFFQYGQYWTSSYYVGTATLLLSFLAVWTLRDRRVRCLACAVLVAFFLALGDQTFIYRLLRQLLPQLSLMTYPVKFITLLVFACPLLAAYSLALFHRDPAPTDTRPPKRRLLILTSLLLALIVTVLIWARLHPLRLDDFPSLLTNGLTRAAFLVAVSALLWALCRQLPERAARFLSLGLLPLIWLDLWTHEPPQNPTVPSSVYAPGVAHSASTMVPEPGLGRSRLMVSPAADAFFNTYRAKDMTTSYLGRRFGFFSDCNLLDEMPKVNGFFSLAPRDYAAIEQALYSSTNASFPHLQDFLAVSQITAAGEFTKFEAKSTFLPEITAGQKPVFLDDTNALAALLGNDFDSRKVVLLPPETRTLLSVSNQTSARVLSSEFSLRRMRFAVEADQATLAVIAQSYYSPWQARVDGKPVPLLRANHAFQAVEVPSGKHQVSLVYEDRLLRLGAVISALTLLGCLWSWLSAFRNRHLGLG